MTFEFAFTTFNILPIFLLPSVEIFSETFFTSSSLVSSELSIINLVTCQCLVFWLITNNYKNCSLKSTITIICKAKEMLKWINYTWTWSSVQVKRFGIGWRHSYVNMQSNKSPWKSNKISDCRSLIKAKFKVPHNALSWKKSLINICSINQYILWLKTYHYNLW